MVRRSSRTYSLNPPRSARPQGSKYTPRTATRACDCSSMSSWSVGTCRTGSIALRYHHGSIWIQGCDGKNHKAPSILVRVCVDATSGWIRNQSFSSVIIVYSSPYTPRFPLERAHSNGPHCGGGALPANNGSLCKSPAKRQSVPAYCIYKTLLNLLKK